MITLSIVIVSLLLSLSGISQDKKQCAGTTKAGTQCQHKTTGTHCKQHDINTPRCGDSTKLGTKCKFIVKVAGAKCHNHKDK